MQIQDKQDSNELQMDINSFDSFEYDLEFSKLSVFLKKDGYYIRYIPGKNEKKYTEEDIKQGLISKGASQDNLDIKKISECLEKSLQNPLKEIKILPLKENLGLENNSDTYNVMKFEIFVDKSLTDAYIKLYPPNKMERILEIDEIYSQINDFKNIYLNNIKKALILEEYNSNIQVAKGIPIVPATPVRIEFKFNAYGEKRVVDDGERVDYKEFNVIDNVSKGQVLAVIHPKNPGKEGLDVYGNILEVPSIEDFIFSLGKNVEFSSDETKVIATTSGYPVFNDNTIFVETTYTIEGNVDFKTGNISFSGPVIISGNVLDGFIVKAESIHVKGNVLNALIEAKMNIIIDGGIVGRKQYVIKCQTLYSKFIENAIIHAQKDVIVKENIMNSIVLAVRVISYGKKGSIIGSQIYAFKNINATFLGNYASTYTYLEVGKDPYFKFKLEDLSKKEEELDLKIKDLDQRISYLQKKKNFDSNKLQTLENIKIIREDLFNQLNRLIEDIKKVKEYLENLNINGKISSKMITYSGVQITINNIKFVVKVETKNKTFYEEGGVINLKAYEPIEVEEKTDKNKK